MRRIGPRAVAIIHGAHLLRRNSDVEYKFRQPSDLLYLTGLVEPEAVAVLAPNRPESERFTMFLRPRDPEREVWTGRRLGVEGARAQLGADQAFPIAELASKLPDLLDGAEELHYLFADDKEVDDVVSAAVRSLWGHHRNGKRGPARMVDLRATLHEMRLFKDEHALAALRRAAAITAEAHVEAMRTVRPGMYEYEIEALVDYTFRRRGAHGPGYGTITGGGANATILHYIENDALLADGALLLVDAGAEVEGFTADVTRTFPVTGRFSPAQRRFYETVLRVQEAIIEAAVPGATIDGLHARTVELLTAGMVELGLLHGEVPALIEKLEHRRYYMHRTSHWLGMDVHDVGAYYESATSGSRALAEGMVITVEPGLYVAADDQRAPAPYRGLGVRIEDDVLITKGGNEVLTRAIPKHPGAIEALRR